MKFFYQQGNSQKNKTEVGIAEILKILGNVYGTDTVSGEGQLAKTVPLHQKLALCTLVVNEKHGKSHEVTLGKVSDNHQSNTK